MEFDPNDFDVSFYFGLPKEKIEEILRNAKPDQKKPVGFYVYGHYEVNGSLFYVGMGTAKRAWSRERHPLWVRYVDTHLGGNYEVRILADGMTSEEGENLETGIIAEYGPTLVNWINIGRQTDFDLLRQYHKLHKANQKLIQETKLLEKTDLQLAIQGYKTALENIAQYVYMEFEKGLVGQLLKEENDELGRNGEVDALNRLTLCLIKDGRASEAAEYSHAYFTRYKRDNLLKSSEKIKIRVEKALAVSSKQKSNK